jgi:nucleoside-diphosphate-sugar epimerase
MLFTGASGFLGINIYPFLAERYNIHTLGLSENDDFKVNLALTIPDLQYNEIVLHAAGKAHSVPKTKSEIIDFYDVNYKGTKNLCLALEKCGVPKSFIFISTVAIYGQDFGENINEDHPQSGKSPYALSKIQAEEFLMGWSKKNNVILGILRPSLIAGPRPPGNLGSMIAGINKNRYFGIAGSKTRKSIVMAEDIGQLIPILAQKGGIYNVCDNSHPSFKELEQLISTQLNKRMPVSIPFWIAKIFAHIGDYLGDKAPINSIILNKLTQNLTFDNQKIKRELDWTPTDVIKNFKIY